VVLDHEGVRTIQYVYFIFNQFTRLTPICTIVFNQMFHSLTDA